MRRKLFFLCVLFFAAACQKDKELQPHDVMRPRQSDYKPNGGLLRFTLGDKPMHDSFFEAQFTPRGQMFDTDNLQLYNYNLNSDKYPQLLINVNNVDSTSIFHPIFRRQNGVSKLWHRSILKVKF